jgi:predicted Fe-S protein YdhL (DUF1289 family)
MSHVPSPCIDVCRLDKKANNTCVGCYRTKEEIAGWMKFTSEEKRSIIELCKQRKGE